MRSTAFVLVVAALFSAGSSLVGQEPIPEPTQPVPQPAHQPTPAPGTWAAEAGVNSGVSILKFRNPRLAWITNVSASYRRSEYEGDPAFDPEDRTTFFGQLMLGLRSYGRAGEQVRPFSTIAGIVTVTSSGSPARVGFGLAGESGGAYFFSPHVSLGAGVRLHVARQSFRDEFGGSGVSSTHVTAQLQTLFLGAVYF